VLATHWTIRIRERPPYWLYYISRFSSDYSCRPRSQRLPERRKRNLNSDGRRAPEPTENRDRSFGTVSVYLGRPTTLMNNPGPTLSAKRPGGCVRRAAGKNLSAERSRSCETSVFSVFPKSHNSGCGKFHSATRLRAACVSKLNGEPPDPGYSTWRKPD
jgi:hypothetical protein